MKALHMQGFLIRADEKAKVPWKSLKINAFSNY